MTLFKVISIGIITLVSLAAVVWSFIKVRGLERDKADEFVAELPKK